MNNKNLEINNNSLLNYFDEAVSEFETLFSNFQQKQEKNMNKINKEINSSSDFKKKNFIATQQYKENDLGQKAFINYLSKGDLSFAEKTCLLSMDSNREGYVIPDITMEYLNDRMRYLCPLRSIAGIVKTRSDSVDVLIDKKVPEASWSLDDLEINSEIVKINIPTHQIYARPKTTQKILDDVGDAVENWFVEKVSQKIAALENHAFLNGTGENQPRGILNYPRTKVGLGGWGKIEHVEQSSKKAEIKRETLIEVMIALKPEYLPNATWLMSRSTLAAIQNIKDDNGKYLWQQSIVKGAPSCLLGHPVVVSDDMPCINVANSTPILFGDFRAGYQIAERSEIKVLRDPYSQKPYVEFFVTKRTGGDMVNFEAIKAISLKNSA